MNIRLSPGEACGIDPPLINAIVADFYGSVRRDPLLGPIFEKRVHDWPMHEELIGRFWSAVLLMNGSYKGTPLQPHLALPSLTEVHFEQWLSLFRNSVVKRCTADQATLFMECASRIATSFRLARERLPIPAPARSLT